MGCGFKAGQAFDAFCCRGQHSLIYYAGDLAGGGGRRALVPGCGRGYAVAALAAAGYQATGLEVSPTGGGRPAYLSTQQGIEGKWQIDEADFFKHTPAQPYDLIYDCTFLCAIPPEARR